MNFHTDHMDEITANWNSAENKNEAQRFGNITTSIYFLILFFPTQFVSFNLLARVRVFPRLGLHAPKCTEESCFLFRWLVYISAVWCIYDAKGLIDMKIYTAIRRCMKIIFVMFGFFTLSYARFYLAFNLGFSRTAAQSKSEKEWEWETEEETCVCVGGWEILNVRDISGIISLLLTVIAAYRLRYSLVVCAA